MTSTTPRRRLSDLKPRPELWAALKDGVGLREILQDFYEIVFKDPRLAPFFVDSTQDRLVEKQWSFMAAIFTGEDLYFGDRPRNAHHWMVIDDDLYDYREEIMEDCLRRYGLSEEMVKDWRGIEEVFRGQIVKDAPIPKRRRGIDLPLEGYESLVLDEGTQCDGCAALLSRGEPGSYHVRTGKLYCEKCHPSLVGEPGK